MNGGGLCHTDGIGELNLAAIGKSCRHDVLGGIAGRISRTPVYLGAVFSGESTAAMRSCSTVGIYNNFTSGETGIPVRSANHETPGRIDEDLGLFIDHLLVYHGVDHIFADVFVNLLLADLLIMLGRNDDSLQTDRLIVLIIFHGNLALAVRTEVGKSTVLAHLGQLLRQLMCQRNSIRHVLLGFVGRITEHHALIARADGLQLLVGHLVLSGFQRLIYAHGDVRRLFVQCNKDGTGVRIKPFFRRVVADLPDGISDHLLVIDIRLGRNLSGHHDKAGAGCRLAGDTAHRILCHAGIQNRIGDIVADLVGMSFCYRLGCKNILVHEFSFRANAQPT